MTEMTRAEIEAWVRRGIAECGGLLAYARQQRMSPSTLENTLKRRHVWTPYTLRLVGLPGVQVVVDPVAQAAPKPVARPYRPMWRLGDWPSRYQVTGE